MNVGFGQGGISSVGGSLNIGQGAGVSIGAGYDFSQNSPTASVGMFVGDPSRTNFSSSINVNKNGFGWQNNFSLNGGPGSFGLQAGLGLNFYDQGKFSGYSLSGGLTYSPEYQSNQNFSYYTYGAGATANMNYKDGQYMGMTTSSYVSAVFDEEKYKNGLKQDSTTRAKQNDAQNATALNYQKQMKTKESGYSAQTTQGTLIGANAGGMGTAPTNNYGFAYNTPGNNDAINNSAPATPSYGGAFNTPGGYNRGETQGDEYKQEALRNLHYDRSKDAYVTNVGGREIVLGRQNMDNDLNNYINTVAPDVGLNSNTANTLSFARSAISNMSNSEFIVLHDFMENNDITSLQTTSMWRPNNVYSANDPHAYGNGIDITSVTINNKEYDFSRSSAGTTEPVIQQQLYNRLICDRMVRQAFDPWQMMYNRAEGTYPNANSPGLEHQHITHLHIGI